MPRNYQREPREGNEKPEGTTAVSVEGTEERSRRRMEEGGGGRERVTDTSSSRVVLSVECAAHMVKATSTPSCSPFILCRDSISRLVFFFFYISYIKLICIFRDSVSVRVRNER